MSLFEICSVNEKTDFSNNDSRNNNSRANFFIASSSRRNFEKKKRNKRKKNEIDAQSTMQRVLPIRCRKLSSSMELWADFWRIVYHIRRIKRVSAAIKELHGGGLSRRYFTGREIEDRFVVLSCRLSYRILREIL